MATLLCLGFGYCARHLVAEFGSRFSRIVGTSRSSKGAPAETVEMLTFDGGAPSPGLRAAIASADRLLVSAPPGEDGDPVPAALADDIAAATRLRSVVYLSSLGVYGDHGGDWIDETAEPRPAHARGAARLRSEQAWQALGREHDLPVAVLRLAGIYGPERNVLLRLLAGRARRVVKPGQAFNRIHAADIAQAIDAAFAQEADGVFNVADDEPAAAGDVVVFAAGLLGIAPPAEVPWHEAEATLSPMMLSFYAGSARVRNAKLKTALGVTLRYPSYREGLQALLHGVARDRDDAVPLS
jgi:nucleoside-diphosphate-sugar epimerase